MTSSRVIRLLNEQRSSGKMCDINFKLVTDFQVWAHFSVIAPQSEFVGKKYFEQEMQFSMQNPLSIELQNFECERCLQLVIDFMYGTSNDGLETNVLPIDPVHSQHILQLARLLTIDELIRESIEPDVELETDTVMGSQSIINQTTVTRTRPKTFQYKIQTQPSKRTSKMHQCIGCSFKCYKPSEMLFHMNSCRSKNTKCNMCDKHFETMTEFKGHLVRHEHQSPFFCNDCDQRFTTKSALNLHTPKHSSKSLHACPDCGKRFKWKHNLNNHMIVHSTEKQLLCDECGYSTSHLKTLRAHQLSHTGFAHRCTTAGCSYTSRRKENLKMHMATHRNETPFVCEVCGHRFSQNKNLKRHALLHVTKNLHKCPHCEFTNYRTDKMKEHILRQHTEKPLQLELAEIVPSALLDDGDSSEVSIGRKKPLAGVKSKTRKLAPKRGAPAFILPKGGSSSTTVDSKLIKDTVSPVSGTSLGNINIKHIDIWSKPNKGFTFILPKDSSDSQKQFIDGDTAVIHF